MWMDIGIVALLLFGVYAFAQLAGWETKALTRRTTRRENGAVSHKARRRLSE